MNSRHKDIDSRVLRVNSYEALRKPGLVSVITCFLLIVLLPDVNGMDKGDPVRGKESFNKRFCSLCHSINGKGGDVGPDLTQVKQRRSDEWLFKWLKDPPLIKPDTVMPKMKWDSDQEILDIISYLKDPG